MLSARFLCSHYNPACFNLAFFLSVGSRVTLWGDQGSGGSAMALCEAFGRCDGRRRRKPANKDKKEEQGTDEEDEERADCADAARTPQQASTAWTASRRRSARAWTS